MSRVLVVSSTSYKTSDDDPDWKHKINDVRSLLDRLKEERRVELNRQNESVMVESSSHTRSEPPAVSPKRWRKAEQENREVVHMHRENKHGMFISEIHEKAELISRSARKEPKKVLHGVEINNEKEDKEKEEFLAKIRAAPTSPMKEVKVTLPINVFNAAPQTTETDTFHHEVSELNIPSKIDLNAEPEVTFILNVGVQKSKAALGKRGSLKGRRRPDAVQRRSRALSSHSSDGMDVEIVQEENEEEMEVNEDKQNRNEIEVFVSGLSSPHTSLSSPPTSPTRTRYEDRRKRGKSMPVGGVAMPVLSEIILHKPYHNHNDQNRNEIEVLIVPGLSSPCTSISNTHRVLSSSPTSLSSPPRSLSNLPRSMSSPCASVSSPHTSLSSPPRSQSSPPTSPTRTRHEDRRKSMPTGSVTRPALSEIILQKPNHNHNEQNRNEIEVFLPGLSSPPKSPIRTIHEDRKMRGKSMPVGGVPALGEILLQNPHHRENRNIGESIPKRQSAAELVAKASKRKEQQAAREERMDTINKPAEKPSWVLEMEARRKRRENAQGHTHGEDAPPVPPRPKHYDGTDSAPHSPSYRTITVTSHAFDAPSSSPPHSPRHRRPSDEEHKLNGHSHTVLVNNTVIATPVVEQSPDLEQSSPPHVEQLPQWKQDLLQKKKKATTKLVAVNVIANTQKAAPVSHGIVILPQWKQDLMERHRQSREQTEDKTDNIPAWKKQLKEKKKSKSPKKDPASTDSSLSEFEKKMAERHKMADKGDTDTVIQASLVSEEIIKDEETPVPSFMKEFEKGKRRVVTVSSFIKKPETERGEPEFFKMRRNIRTAAKYQT